MFEVDFWGAVGVSREAVRFFREENSPPGGRLINVSTLAAIIPTRGIEFYGARWVYFTHYSYSFTDVYYIVAQNLKFSPNLLHKRLTTVGKLG